jgi:hypothetical protein
MTNQTFKKRVDFAHGHDWVTVSAERGYGDLIEIEFEGRDSTTVTVRLTEPAEARALGEALIEAAAALEVNGQDTQ